MAATHRRVTMTGIDILHLKDGRVVERWGQTNGLELMQQLGVAP
jgi:predicted ester cyclase